jgi:hypothetical protein
MRTSCSNISQLVRYIEDAMMVDDETVCSKGQSLGWRDPYGQPILASRLFGRLKFVDSLLSIRGEVSFLSVCVPF